MHAPSNEQQLYQLQHKSVNEPQQLIDDLKNASGNNRTFLAHIQQLFLARALLVMGEVQPAFDILCKLKTDLEKRQDFFCLGKCYIMLYNAQSLLGVNAKENEECFKLAEKNVKLSCSRALNCEMKLLFIHKCAQDCDLVMSENFLQEAMQDAIEVDVLDLKLDVHFAYGFLYMNNNLPEMAYQEFLLLRELIHVEQNPYLYVQILNHMGIVRLMMKDLTKAEEYISAGITLAREKGYLSLLILLLINLGITYVSSGRIQQGIEIYKQCLQIISDKGLDQSLNASRTRDNLANAYCRIGESDTAIQLLQTSMDIAVKAEDKVRINSLKVNLANTLIEQEKYSEAEKLLDASIDFFDQSNNYQYLTIAYRCKARMFEARENYKEAFSVMALLDRTNQKYFQENFVKQTQKYQSRIDYLRDEYVLLKNQCAGIQELSKLYMNSELIGEHPSVRKAVSDAFMAAKYPFTNVFITGESGTGKEIIARIIHNESKINKPMVAINASAISPHLIESELFGHKKGAFTGAINDQKGKFLQADKSTLLLDDISEMPLECQAKLLRAIETHAIAPVGSDREVNVKCRVISTSNCHMPDLIRANKFRLDLYHRLNKVEIHLTPLRERLSDLELLTNHFVKHFAVEFNMPLPTLTEAFFNRLREYSFPGNIRELMNICERIFILKPKSVWDASQLDGLVQDTKTWKPQVLPVGKNLKSMECQLITDVLEQCKWVQKEAAVLLGMTESTLTRRIKSLEIRRPPV